VGLWIFAILGVLVGGVLGLLSAPENGKINSVV